MYDKLQLGLPSHHSKPAILFGPCVLCNEEIKVRYPCDKMLIALEKYQNRERIQHCFPDMSVDDREFLVSGICPKCWNEKLTGPKDQSVTQSSTPPEQEFEVIEEFEELDEFSSDSFIGDAVEDFLPTEWPVEIDPIQNLPEDLK